MSNQKDLNYINATHGIPPLDPDDGRAWAEIGRRINEQAMTNSPSIYNTSGTISSPTVSSPTTTGGGSPPPGSSTGEDGWALLALPGIAVVWVVISFPNEVILGAAAGILTTGAVLPKYVKWPKAAKIAAPIVAALTVAGGTFLARPILPEGTIPSMFGIRGDYASTTNNIDSTPSNVVPYSATVPQTFVPNTTPAPPPLQVQAPPSQGADTSQSTTSDAINSVEAASVSSARTENSQDANDQTQSSAPPTSGFVPPVSVDRGLYSNEPLPGVLTQSINLYPYYNNMSLAYVNSKATSIPAGSLITKEWCDESDRFCQAVTADPRNSSRPIRGIIDARDIQYMQRPDNPQP